MVKAAIYSTAVNFIKVAELYNESFIWKYLYSPQFLLFYKTTIKQTISTLPRKQYVVEKAYMGSAFDIIHSKTESKSSTV